MDKKKILDYVEWTITREPIWADLHNVSFNTDSTCRRAREINTFQILHGALGLASELPELERVSSEVNQLEEYGDCFWYLASIVRGLRVQQLWAEQLRVMEEVTTPCTGYVAKASLQEVVGVLLDQVKRNIFYSAFNHEFLQTLVVIATDHLLRLVKYSGFSLEQVLDANKAKLEKRYKEKHSNEEALNRDLEAEAVAMQNVLNIVPQS